MARSLFTSSAGETVLRAALTKREIEGVILAIETNIYTLKQDRVHEDDEASLLLYDESIIKNADLLSRFTHLLGIARKFERGDIQEPLEE